MTINERAIQHLKELDAFSVPNPIVAKACKCHEHYDCCDCGGNECGCSYCFSCNACEECLSE